MEILNYIPKLYANAMVAILVFSRISTMLTTFNLLRRGMMTAQILLSLSVILTLYVILLNDIKPLTYDFMSLSMIIAEMLQCLIGFVSALILNIVFDVFMAFGQIVSTQTGLSIVGLFDPRFGSVTVLTQFYLITASIVFLSLNGHLFVIKVIVESFQTLPVNQLSISPQLIEQILSYAGIIFSGSIVLALTVIVIILLTNITLSMMSKFAPQINLFSIGINLSIIIGLITLFVTYDLLVTSGTDLIHENLNFFHKIMAG